MGSLLGEGPSFAAIDFETADYGRDTGTEITLRTAGLDPAVVYWLWLSPTDDPDDRIAAGTFRGTADQEATLQFFAGLPRDDAVRIWITADDGLVADSELA